jgi:hypothetical protein
MNAHTLQLALESGSGRVWRTSLEATVLIGLVFAIQFLFKGLLAPRCRYALGLLILVRLALPIVPAGRLSVFNLEKWAPIRLFAENQPRVAPGSLREAVGHLTPSPQPSRPVGVREKKRGGRFRGAKREIGVGAF